MDKCNKCGSVISDDDYMAWKCTSCGKAFKVNLSKLKRVQVQKDKPENAGKMLLKCPTCGNGMDDGDEMIACKCSVCGNVSSGNLKYFVGKEEGYDEGGENNAENRSINLIECSNDVPDQVKTYRHCGYEILKEDKQIKEKHNISIYEKYISALICIVGCIFLVMAITRITNDEYRFYKQHYQKCVDGYNDIKSTADSYGGGLFRGSYNSIAFSYKNMADDDNKELWKFRIQAIVLVCGGFGLIICGYKKYKKRKIIALKKCPRCGKENVSNSVKSCLNCGFQIEDYYRKKNKVTVDSKYLHRVNKKEIIMLGVIAFFVWTLYFFPTRCKHDGCYHKKMASGIFCSYHQSKLDGLLSYAGSYNSYSNNSSKKIDASTIFHNLDITNFSAGLGKHSGTMRCEVTNGNSYTVNGYFYVNYYDKNGTLLYSQLMPLPDVASGEKVTCSTIIPKGDYPSNYDHVEFSQASLTKSN